MLWRWRTYCAGAKSFALAQLPAPAYMPYTSHLSQTTMTKVRLRNFLKIPPAWVMMKVTGWMEAHRLVLKIDFRFFVKRRRTCPAFHETAYSSGGSPCN